jgi:predicted SAM-dependent methyltransferase
MRSFLEHEVQPQVLLNGVFRILQPDGVAFVKVPNYGGLNRRVMGRSWCGFRYPDHVNYFTLNSLRAMAFKAGFSLRLLNPLNLALDDNIHALLRKPAQGPASVR